MALIETLRTETMENRVNLLDNETVGIDKKVLVALVKLFHVFAQCRALNLLHGFLGGLLSHGGSSWR